MNEIERIEREAIIFFLQNLLERGIFPVKGIDCLNDIIWYLDFIETHSNGKVYKTWILGRKFKVRYQFKTKQFEFFASDDPLKHWTV